MNVQERADQQDEAKKIWDQLEADDAGGAQPADEPSDDPQEGTPSPAESTDQAPANHHNDVSADAKKDGVDPAPTAEQALLDKVTGLEAMLTQVTQRLRNAEGHIGGLGEARIRQE